jgi:hypothetical protein
MFTYFATSFFLLLKLTTEYVKSETETGVLNTCSAISFYVARNGVKTAFLLSFNFSANMVKIF